MSIPTLISLDMQFNQSLCLPDVGDIFPYLRAKQNIKKTLKRAEGEKNLAPFCLFFFPVTYPMQRISIHQCTFAFFMKDVHRIFVLFCYLFNLVFNCF